MYRRNLLLLAVGLSVLPAPSVVLGATLDGKLAAVGNSSEPSDPLFRARWSLPSYSELPKSESSPAVVTKPRPAPVISTALVATPAPTQPVQTASVSGFKQPPVVRINVLPTSQQTSLTTSAGDMQADSVAPSLAPVPGDTQAAPMVAGGMMHRAVSGEVPAVQKSTSAATVVGTNQITKSPAPENLKVIETGVSVWDSANVSKVVDHLVDINCATSKTAQDLDKQVKHFSSKTVRTFNGAKDALNQSFMYEGTDPSQRMGKVVLDDKAKIRDHVTAEYERQKYVDKIHSQVISALSQIATGLGTTDSTRRAQIINSGVKSLNNLVGAEQADKATINLTTWLTSAKVSDGAFDKPAWDTMERDEKLERVLRGAFEKDAVISEVRKRVNRYANPGKIKSTASRTVETTLTMASWLAPGWTIPIAAEAALDGFIAATGGTEESKIEKELIYDKRIQSRIKVLSSEATLALDNYRFALVTKNAPLLTLSEALIADMSNDKLAEEVLEGQVEANKHLAEQAIPEITESKEAPPKGTKVKRIVRSLKDL